MELFAYRMEQSNLLDVLYMYILSFKRDNSFLVVTGSYQKQKFLMTRIIIKKSVAFIIRL